MNRKEFFEDVVNHFLFVSKNEGNVSSLGYPGYSLLSLKLNGGVNKLTINTEEKLILDQLNSLKHPVIEDLKEDSQYSILPSTDGWESLTLKTPNGLNSINRGLSDLIKTEFPVIDFNDLKLAMKADHLELPLKLCKVDIGLSSELKGLNEILLKKLAIYSKNDFYTQLVKNFLVVKKEGNNYNICSLTFDSNLKESYVFSDMDFLDNYNIGGDNGLITGFDENISETFISPPTNEWKSLTIERTKRKQSLYKGISSLVALGFPVIFYDDLMDGIKNNSFKIPIRSCKINRLVAVKDKMDDLKNLMMFRFGVKIEDYSTLRKSSKGLELEPTTISNSFQSYPSTKTQTRTPVKNSTRLKKKKPFWKIW